jgi:hypothetical protein
LSPNQKAVSSVGIATRVVTPFNDISPQETAAKKWPAEFVEVAASELKISIAPTPFIPANTGTVQIRSEG